MKFKKNRLDGILVIEPDVFNDNRGFFFESYSKRKFTENGIALEFVQDNRSMSSKGIVRGLHYQVRHPQDKLIMALSGEIYDVVVDIRPSSPTFGQWEGFIISAYDKRQIFIPKGFAHGFCVLSDFAEIFYKCSDFYSHQDERGILWNDPTLKIEWPIKNPVLSKKDSLNSLLKDIDREEIAGDF